MQAARHPQLIMPGVLLRLVWGSDRLGGSRQEPAALSSCLGSFRGVPGGEAPPAGGVGAEPAHRSAVAAPEAMWSGQRNSPACPTDSACNKLWRTRRVAGSATLDIQKQTYYPTVQVRP